MKFSIVLAILLLLVIPLGLAQSVDYVFQQNNEASIQRACFSNGDWCNSATFCNSTVTSPDGSLNINNIQETNAITYHNFTIPAPNLSDVGDYTVLRSCNNGTNSGAETYKFKVTVSGFDRINTGESISFIAGAVIMIIISLLMFLMFFKSENVPIKMAFLSGSVILLFMSVLLAGIIFQQNLAGFSSVITGYETFIFVMKMLMTLGLVAFFLFILIFIFGAIAKAWKIKRGFIDLE